MEFLNSRKAVVVVHPTQPFDYYDGVNKSLPLPVFEYFVETTRTFINMVLMNTFVRFPEIRWVFPHAGAFIPLISDRFDACWNILMSSNPDADTDFYKAIKHVYFDLAGFPLPKQVPIMKQNVPVQKMLYGSDCSYTPGLVCIGLAGSLERTKQFSDQEKAEIFTGNALELFPQLKGIVEFPKDDLLKRARRVSLKKRLSRRMIYALFDLFVSRNMRRAVTESKKSA